MKIYAVSDLHGNLDGLDPCDADLVIIAGDLAPMKGWSVWHVNDQVKWINRKFSAWCEKYPQTEFVVIPGNHDLFAQRNDVPTKVVWSANVHFIVDRVVEVKGLRIAGSPWIPPISGRWAFETRDETELASRFAWIPEGVDILITHTPPFVEDWNVDGYTQSDEISLLVRDDQNLDTEAWFDKRLQKVVSLAAASATYWFNSSSLFEKKVPAFFDARAFVLPENEVRNYFIWRQEDATTNSLSMLAQSLYAHEALQHRKWSDLQDLCWRKGQNWNDLETAEKRGVCVYRHRVVVPGRQGPVERMKFFVDREIPIFTSRDADGFWRQFVSFAHEVIGASVAHAHETRT